jgi:hypothetical protein
MIDRTATARILPRASMLAPLAIFFVACFFIAGVLKFRAFGNDIWLARPAGALVTCLFLGFVAWLAGRWFFGNPPRAIGRKLLSALVVLLPLMGLLGAFQLTTNDAATAALDPTPLGGSLGLMLAGPKAFGLLGSTIAGILFATLAGIGCLLARRMTFDARVKASGEDPYAVIKAMQKTRGAPAEAAASATAVVDEDETPAAAEEGASLFPVDAELEPETASAAAPAPIAEIEVVEEISAPRVIEEPPKRVPVLAGIVDEAALEHEDDLPPARFLASALVLEPETREAEPMVIDLEEPVMAGAVQEAEVEIEVGVEMGQPSAEPQPEPEIEVERPRIMVLPPPTVETEEETSLEPEDEDDPSNDEPELAGIMGGEAPELTLEWMAAPTAFHTPRLSDEEPVITNEAMEEILDVETAKEPEPVVEAEPEPAPMPERRRFRVKAVVEEETPPPVVEEVAPEPVFEIPAELAAQLLGEPMPVEEIAETPGPVEIPPPVEEIAETPAPVAEPEEVEAQLELPSMPPPAAAPDAEADDETQRPKRRMRSAKKDWASWDEPKSKERPRLRLVKSDEPAAEETETQAEIPVATSGADDSYDRAVKLVVKEDRCSVSLLQRNLGVTFGEATALIDRMYQQGVVGPYQPTGRRDVLVNKKGKAAAEES